LTQGARRGEIRAPIFAAARDRSWKMFSALAALLAYSVRRAFPALLFLSAPLFLGEEGFSFFPLTHFIQKAQP
jgi:hypothetical protein